MDDILETSFYPALTEEREINQSNLLLNTTQDLISKLTKSLEIVKLKRKVKLFRSTKNLASQFARLKSKRSIKDVPDKKPVSLVKLHKNTGSHDTEYFSSFVKTRNSFRKPEEALTFKKFTKKGVYRTVSKQHKTFFDFKTASNSCEKDNFIKISEGLETTRSQFDSVLKSVKLAKAALKDNMKGEFEKDREGKKKRILLGKNDLGIYYFEGQTQLMKDTTFLTRLDEEAIYKYKRIIKEKFKMTNQILPIEPKLVTKKMCEIYFNKRHYQPKHKQVEKLLKDSIKAKKLLVLKTNRICSKLKLNS